jgi:hypothetical protein
MLPGQNALGHHGYGFDTFVQLYSISVIKVPVKVCSS